MSPAGQPPKVANILPDESSPRRTPQSLPLRERVWLAQRIALARWLGIKWTDIALLEGMSERTLRYHLARWKAELERETEPTSELMRACEERAEHYTIAFAPRSTGHRARDGRQSGRAARRSQAPSGTGDS